MKVINESSTKESPHSDDVPENQSLLIENKNLSMETLSTVHSDTIGESSSVTEAPSEIDLNTLTSEMAESSLIQNATNETEQMATNKIFKKEYKTDLEEADCRSSEIEPVTVLPSADKCTGNKCCCCSLRNDCHLKMKASRWFMYMFFLV